MKKLTQKFANVDAMKAAGYTDADLEALKNGPRSRAAEFDEAHTYFRWPFIDGISIVGLYSLLTDDEKAAYRAYKKKHLPNGTSSSSSKMSDEDKQKWARLKEFCKDKPEALALVEALMPKERNSLLKQMLNVDNVGELKGKVTMAYVMYRGPNNEFGDNPATFSLKDAFRLWKEDFVPAFSKQAVLDNIEKLKTKGIDLSNVIVA